MSRKSLLLIAAAVISIPALTTSNALAKGSYGAVSTPHVSTLGASRVVVPQAKFRKGPADGAAARSQVQKFLDARQKAGAGSAPVSNGGPFGQAVDKAKKIGEDAAKAARDAAEAKAKLQTPASAGSQIPTPPPPPPPPPTPKGTPDGGYRPHFPAPGGVVVFGSDVSIDPVVVQPGPIVAGSTATGRTATTSRVAGAVTDGATTPRPNPCNCLVKERLQDGSVLFKDICTRESARSVPANDTATPRDAQ